MRRWGRRRCRGPHGRHGHHGHHGHVHEGNRRLFWRVYLHGFFLLFAVAAALGVLGFAMGRNPGWSQAFEYKRLLEQHPGLLHDPRELDALVHKAGDRANANISVYTPPGQLLATNVDPPLSPLSDQSVRALGTELVQLGRPRWMVVMPIRHGGQLAAYVVTQWRGPGAEHIARGISYILGVLLVLALASIPLVRTIVSPLERLTRAVRALGAGDLSTRSGIRRRDEVGELAEAFDEMAARMERLVRNERELLANVSHELRTPLSRIRVALELAAEGDAERARRYLREIGSDLAELERLVEDVLTAARLDAQKGTATDGFPLHSVALDPGELLDEAARKFHEAWPDRVLHADVPAGLPAIDADPVLLRRVVDNLLDNARKYSDEAKPVTLLAREEGSELVIEVKDEGIGLTPDDLRQLFTPFFRSDRSRQRGTGGVGLGLALAKRIVEAHAGTLSASSEPGQGSTFTLRLPVRRVEV